MCKYEGIKFVDLKDYSLERLSSEKNIEKKKREIEKRRRNPPN